MSEAQVKTKKPVICIETGIEYESMKAAARATGTEVTQIGRVCSGKIQTTKGYKFKWLEKKNEI